MDLRSKALAMLDIKVIAKFGGVIYQAKTSINLKVWERIKSIKRLDLIVWPNDMTWWIA